MSHLIGGRAPKGTASELSLTTKTTHRKRLCGLPSDVEGYDSRHDTERLLPANVGGMTSSSTSLSSSDSDTSSVGTGDMDREGVGDG